MKKLFWVMVLSSMSLIAYASNSVSPDTLQMNNNLVRLVNQIDAMMPIIDNAKALQDPNARIQFHFDTWTDAKGQVHLGLRQDLFMMRESLVAQINGTSLTPTTVQPLENDFVGR